MSPSPTQRSCRLESNIGGLQHQLKSNYKTMLRSDFVTYDGMAERNDLRSPRATLRERPVARKSPDCYNMKHFRRNDTTELQQHFGSVSVMNDVGLLRRSTSRRRELRPGNVG